jgi:CheY-like chemotaxis protein
MPTVLIVDDEEAITALLSELVTELGYRSIVANNGQAALAMLRSLPHPPDLILTDVMMPKMGGVEFVEAARVLPKLRQVPVVMMTAAPAAVQDGLSDALIAKPFELSQLILLIQSLLPPARAVEERV